MKTDLRRYGYWDYEPLINKESQMMTYLDGKFSGIDIKVDTGAIADAVDDTVKKTLDSNQVEMDEKFRRISREIARSTDVII
ncbi:MAG: hypothetical protein LUD72_10520, partial [Bacteroidales bacterium]|nr:hypothetical protein [Bacteroidales bacterium]